MSTSNYPTNSSYDYDETPKRSNSKNVVIIVLILAILGSWGYLVVHGNDTKAVQDQNQSQIAKMTDDKSVVQKNFDESLVRLDSMSGLSNTMKARLTANNSEIAKKKAQIRSILHKSNASAADLAKAQALIAQLNDQISTMEAKVASLTQDNQNLTQDNAALTQDKQKLTDDITATTTTNDSLSKKVDIASTLNATNIAITPVDIKKDGKEKITTNAKRVNELMISFNVNNRIAQSGSTDVFVCVTGPDGKNIAVQSLGSGTFTTREEGDKSFTAKVPVTLDSAKTQKVEFGFKPGSSFQRGSYTIQIYQNGFKIGEGTRELKKGGLFS